MRPPAHTGRLLTITTKQLDYELEISLYKTLNKVFLSRNYRLIVARGNLMFLTQIFAREAKLRGQNMLVLRTSNFQGAIIRLHCLYCSPLNFLPRRLLPIVLVKKHQTLKAVLVFCQKVLK